MNRNQIKKQHLSLSKKEPFTKKEEAQYNKKDQSMIRNIQILNNINKKEAISAIKMYKSTPKQTLRRLAKAYRERLEKYSSSQKPDSRGEIKPPKIIKEKGKPHIKKARIELEGYFKTNREKVKVYLNNPKNREQAAYIRILKGSKKYIDASVKEIRYGINSPRSQNYREKIGLNRQYEGRIIK